MEADPEDPLRSIADALTALGRSVGTSRWRVAAEAVDVAYDRMIDRILDGSLEDPGAFARTVLRNLARSGPDRVDAANERCRPLDSADRSVAATRPTGAVLDDSPDDPGSVERMLGRSDRHACVEYLIEAVQSVTEPERVVLRAVWSTGSFAAAAKRTGMERRDVRNRFDRGVTKLRRWVEELREGS